SRKKSTKVKETDLVLFTRQLSTMIEAGISLVQALTALYEQADPKRQGGLRAVISDITARVQGGETFHESLAKHPLVFNRLFISMVKAGEHGGLLAEILDRLAGFLEASAHLRAVDTQWCAYVGSTRYCLRLLRKSRRRNQHQRSWCRCREGR